MEDSFSINYVCIKFARDVRTPLTTRYEKKRIFFKVIFLRKIIFYFENTKLKNVFEKK